MNLSLALFASLVYWLHFGHQFLYQIMYIKAITRQNVLDFYFFQHSRGDGRGGDELCTDGKLNLLLLTQNSAPNSVRLLTSLFELLSV